MIISIEKSIGSYSIHADYNGIKIVKTENTKEDDFYQYKNGEISTVYKTKKIEKKIVCVDLLVQDCFNNLAKMDLNKVSKTFKTGTL